MTSIRKRRLLNKRIKAKTHKVRYWFRPNGGSEYTQHEYSYSSRSPRGIVIHRPQNGFYIYPYLEEQVR